MKNNRGTLFFIGTFAVFFALLSGCGEGKGDGADPYLFRGFGSNKDQQPNMSILEYGRKQFNEVHGYLVRNARGRKCIVDPYKAVKYDKEVHAYKVCTSQYRCSVDPDWEIIYDTALLLPGRIGVGGIPRIICPDPEEEQDPSNPYVKSYNRHTRKLKIWWEYHDVMEDEIRPGVEPLDFGIVLEDLGRVLKVLMYRYCQSLDLVCNPLKAMFNCNAPREYLIPTYRYMVWDEETGSTTEMENLGFDPETISRETNAFLEEEARILGKSLGRNYYDCKLSP